MRFTKDQLILLGIIVVAFVLRLVMLNQSLWLDEAIGALAVKSQNLISIITDFPYGDNHPPLYYMLLDVWSSLFGYSEIALRSLSVIFGVAAIFVVYKIAETQDEKTKSFKLLTALFITTSHLHIYYSQEARMYIFTGLFASLAVYFFIRTLEENYYRHWFGFAISICLLVFSDYTPVFLLPIFLIYALYKIKSRKWNINFALSFVPIVLLGLLWMPIFISQVQSGEKFLQALPEWRNIAGGASVKQALLVWTKFVIGRISFADKIFYYSYVAVASIPFGIALHGALKSKLNLVLVKLWLCVPLVLVYLFSLKTPAFNYFRFNFILPAFYLLLAYGVSLIKLKPVKYFVVFGILIVNILGVVRYWLDTTQQRENWRGAVADVEQKATATDIVVFENTEPFAPYRWYSQGKVKSFGATDALRATFATQEKTSRLVEDVRGVWYFEYLHDLNDPADYVRKTLGDKGFRLDKVYTYTGVGQISYFLK